VFMGTLEVEAASKVSGAGAGAAAVMMGVAAATAGEVAAVPLVGVGIVVFEAEAELLPALGRPGLLDLRFDPKPRVLNRELIKSACRGEQRQSAQSAERERKEAGRETKEWRDGKREKK
jgi:hypothetical protein